MQRHAKIDFVWRFSLLDSIEQYYLAISDRDLVQICNLAHSRQNVSDAMCEDPREQDDRAIK